MVEKAIVALIGLVIFIIIATGFGGTIVDNTDTSVGNSLENASATGKTMYATVEFLYPILIVLAMIGAFGLGKKL